MSVPSLSKTPEEGKRSHFFSAHLETRSTVGRGRERAADTTPAVRSSGTSHSVRPRPLPLEALLIGTCKVQPTPEVAGTVSDVRVDAADRDRHRSCHYSDALTLLVPLVAYALRSGRFSRLIALQGSDAFHHIPSLAPEHEARSYPPLLLRIRFGSRLAACG